MNPRLMVTLSLVAVVVGVASYWFKFRGPGKPTPVVAICTRDLYKLFREHSTRPLPESNARARCECINRELEKTTEGREVQRLVVEHKKFMDIIESAASHAAAFEAMGLCNQ